MFLGQLDLNGTRGGEEKSYYFRTYFKMLCLQEELKKGYLLQKEKKCQLSTFSYPHSTWMCFIITCSVCLNTDCWAPAPELLAQEMWESGFLIVISTDGLRTTLLRTTELGRTRPIIISLRSLQNNMFLHPLLEALIHQGWARSSESIFKSSLDDSYV